MYTLLNMNVYKIYTFIYQTIIIYTLLIYIRRFAFTFFAIKILKSKIQDQTSVSNKFIIKNKNFKQGEIIK